MREKLILIAGTAALVCAAYLWVAHGGDVADGELLPPPPPVPLAQKAAPR